MIVIRLKIEEKECLDIKEITAKRIDVDVDELSKDESKEERKVAEMLHKRIKVDDIEFVNECKDNRNVEKVKEILKIIESI